MSTDTETPETAGATAPAQTASNEGSLGGGERSLDMLLDVPLQVTVELGRRKMRIGDLLALVKGSVVELATATWHGAQRPRGPAA